MSNSAVPATSPPEGRPADIAELAKNSNRDLVVDVARVFCVFAVVFMHSLMIGLHRQGDTIAQINPLQTQHWFALATWSGQIMPLFFVVGGFASFVSWRSALRRGTSAAAFLRGRLLRLLRPALPLLAFLTGALWLCVALGVDPGLVDLVAAGVGMPLWFLAAYIACQAFLPLVYRLHARRPGLTFAVLVAMAAVVDTTRIQSGIAEIGLLNLVFVWLAVQQLGFFYADGWFARRSSWQLVLGAAASYGLLAAATYATGIYPVDMLTNLNPATLPLVLLGIAQVCLLRLLYPVLAAAMRLKPVIAATFFIGSRAMSIYLWHLPIIVALGGALFLTGWLDSTPGSGAWWSTRPFFVISVWVVLAGVTALVARWERPPVGTPDAPRRSGWRVPLATALSFLTFVAEIEWGLSLWLVTVSAASVTACLWLLREQRTPRL
jgi:surface polysaccharide O-acyltransferase-like enzyme